MKKPALTALHPSRKRLTLPDPIYVPPAEQPVTALPPEENRTESDGHVSAPSRADIQNAFQPILAQSVWLRAPSAAAGRHHLIGTRLCPRHCCRGRSQMQQTSGF